VKVSKRFSLYVIFILLFVMLFLAVFSANVNFKSVVSIAMVGSNENKDEEEEIIDISKIAYGVDNRITLESISNVAINIERVEVYDGLTIEELIDKLNKSLNGKGVLSGQGGLIATRSVELGINPYMAVAIMLHETGCNWNCSTLARVNYNVGGMRGRGGWQKFSSIEEGINAFLNNLYKNYYKYGLNTPEKIGPKYAGSASWPQKINSYINKIKAI